MKTGLVLEGGGMRGIYTVGVLDCLMHNNLQADYVIGVSAGACNGISYVSGQQRRTLRITQKYLADPRYVSLQNYIRTRSLFGMDFIFDEIANKLDPFDYKAFYASSTEYVVGVTDICTGKPAFFGKRALEPKNKLLRASSSIPCFSPIVPFRGGLYLDGGTAAPIPAAQAMAHGCDRLIVVLTRDRSYEKHPEALKALCSHMYKDYPELLRAIERRHLIYNAELDLVRRLERSGKAIVIAPSTPLNIARFENSYKKLLPYYKMGILDTQKSMIQLRKWLRNSSPSTNSSFK